MNLNNELVDFTQRRESQIKPRQDKSTAPESFGDRMNYYKEDKQGNTPTKPHDSTPQEEKENQEACDSCANDSAISAKDTNAKSGKDNETYGDIKKEVMATGDVVNEKLESIIQIDTESKSMMDSNASENINIDIDTTVKEIGAGVNLENIAVQTQTPKISPEISTSQQRVGVPVKQVSTGQSTSKVGNESGTHDNKNTNVVDVLHQESEVDTDGNNIKMVDEKPLEMKSGSVMPIVSKVQNNSFKDAIQEEKVVVASQIKTDIATKQTSETITKDFPQITERTHILDKSWAKNVSSKIALHANNGSVGLKININPMSMGPIEISIANVNDSVSVSMLVVNPATKELLDSNLDKMQKSLEDEGMNLSGFDINHQNQQSNSNSEDSGSQSTRIENYNNDNSNIGSELFGEENFVGGGESLVDSYA